MLTGNNCQNTMLQNIACLLVQRIFKKIMQFANKHDSRIRPRTFSLPYNVPQQKHYVCVSILT